MNFFPGRSSTFIMNFHRILYLIIVIKNVWIFAEVINDDNEVGSKSDDLMEMEERNAGERRDFRGFGHDENIDTGDNSPALNKFLEDVLNAQEELKWIDREVHRSSSKGHRRNKDTKDGKNNRNRYPNSYGGPRRIYLQDEIKPKRDIDFNQEIVEKTGSGPSLASIKRTVLELCDSLSTEQCEFMKNNGANGRSNFETNRKLLSLGNVRSDFTIEYYDYEEGVDVAGINDLKHKEPYKSPGYSPSKLKIPKKDENSENKRRKERYRERLKNKYPKEEFIGETQENKGESEMYREKSRVPPSSSSSIYTSLVLKRIPETAPESDGPVFYNQWEKSLDDLRDQEVDDYNFERHKTDVNVDDLDDEDIESRVSNERTYLIISPRVVRRSREISRDIIDEDDDDDSSLNFTGNFDVHSNDREKSVKNYLALKNTDDMFKGGIEQSNPLDEDNPVYEGQKIPDSTYVSNNSLVSIKKKSGRDGKSFKTRLGRHLTEFMEGDYPNSQIYTNHSIILETSSTDQDATKMESSSVKHKNLSVADESTTLIMQNFTDKDADSNSTRLRRHVETFENEDPVKYPSEVRGNHFQRNFQRRDKFSTDEIDVETHRRKLTNLLAVDNVEDESQIDLAAHGELAGKIVEKIFEEVQHNKDLKVNLGPGLYRNHKPQESMALDKMYRQGLDEDEVKETEIMMRRVMELLGKLVIDEVRRKTCASLPPDLRDFLDWSFGLQDQSEHLSDQVTEKHSDDNFPFDSSDSDINDLKQLEKKVSLLKSLINEYRGLTEREKTKVQTVHDYLVKQLGLLMKYIHMKESIMKEEGSERTDNAGSRLPSVNQQIMQYQDSAFNFDFPRSQNISNASDIHSATKNNNYSAINSKSTGFPSTNYEVQEDSWKDQIQPKQEFLETRRFRREKRRNRNKNYRNINDNKSVEYRKLLRQIAELRRKKREDSLGYEKPRIYIESVDDSLRLSLSTGKTLDQTVPPLSFSRSFIYPVNSSTSVREKNRLENEVLLLKKREAWGKENERLLEKIAFGKDTKSDLTSDSQVASHSALDQYEIDRDKKIQMEHAFDKNASFPTSTSLTFDNGTINVESTSDDPKDDLQSIEKKINVFPVESEQNGEISTEESLHFTAKN